MSLAGTPPGLRNAAAILAEEPLAPNPGDNGQRLQSRPTRPGQLPARPS
jgi:hypothetical protein